MPWSVEMFTVCKQRTVDGASCGDRYIQRNAVGRKIALTPEILAPRGILLFMGVWQLEVAELNIEHNGL